MENNQLNHDITFTEVHFTEVVRKYGSSKNKPMKTITYVRKFVTEVPCIPVRGIDMRSLLVAHIFLGRLRGGLGV